MLKVLPLEQGRLHHCAGLQIRAGVDLRVKAVFEAPAVRQLANPTLCLPSFGFPVLVDPWKA
jgi:hypothetical protein